MSECKHSYFHDFKNEFCEVIGNHASTSSAGDEGGRLSALRGAPAVESDGRRVSVSARILNAGRDRTRKGSVRLYCRCYPSPDPHFRGRELVKELINRKKKHLKP